MQQQQARSGARSRGGACNERKMTSKTPKAKTFKTNETETLCKNRTTKGAKRKNFRRDKQEARKCRTLPLISACPSEEEERRSPSSAQPEVSAGAAGCAPDVLRTRPRTGVQRCGTAQLQEVSKCKRADMHAAGLQKSLELIDGPRPRL